MVLKVYILFLVKEFNLWIVGSVILGIVIFIVVVSYFSKKNLILRELKKDRRKQLISVKENEYAKVIGKVFQTNQPLIAPLSGRACVYYEVLIEKKGDKSWHQFIKEEKAQDFFIKSQGEMAKVKANIQANSKRVFLVKDFKKTSGFRKESTMRFDNFLEKHDKSSIGLLGFNKTLRYREGIIEINENIAVKGIGNWKSLKESIEGFSYSRILTFSGNPKEKLIITDLAEALKRVQRKL
jgi:hypothetical protein